LKQLLLEVTFPLHDCGCEDGLKYVSFIRTLAKHGRDLVEAHHMPLTSGIGGKIKDFFSDTFRREVFSSKIKAAIGYISGMSKAQILLFGSFLCILVVAVLARILPLRWGFFLTEFDPYFQYRIADYVTKNGYAAWFRWHDDMSWYPFGRTVYTTAFPALGFTAAALYSFLRLMGLNVTVLQVCIVFPVVWGVLTVAATYQLGKDVWSRTAGLFAALFLALNGSHISRTSLGFFDDETIGVLTMVVVFLLYLRAISSQRTMKSTLAYGVMCGLSLAYLSCGWGAFRYVMVLLYVFTALMVLLKRYNTRMLIAFVPTYGIQLAIASQLPYLGTKLLTEWSTLPVFGVLALLVMSELWRRVSTTRMRLFTVAGIGGIVCAAFLILWYQGFAYSLMGKLLAVIDPALRLNMPLVESVAEHRPATWASFFHESGILLFLSIFGFVFVAQRARDSDIFLLLFGLSSVYFAGSLVRLTLILAPALSILAAVTMVELAKPAVDIIREAAIFPRRKVRFSARVGREFGAAILLVLILVIVPTFARITTQAYSPATVVTSSFPTSPKEGEEQNYQDWLEALSWMKENLPRDAVVMSWWDYGYWITTYAEKRTLADNGTINSTQIAMIARAFILNETMSVPILKEYNVSHIAVYAAWDKSQQQQIQFYGVGEDSKWYWMAKICNGTVFRGQKILVTENRTESDTLYYRKVLQGGKVISSDLISDKQGIKPNTVVGYLVLKAAGLEYSESEHFTSAFNSKKNWVAVYSVIYPEPSLLDFSLTPKKITYNESLVELSGRISSKATGLVNMTVVLEYSGDKGQNWNELATVYSDRQGAYKYTWTPSAGSYLVRARWDGIQRKFSAAKSTSFELVVDKARLTLSVEPSALDVPAKQDMTITCKLSKPITLGTITVDYSLDNKTWSAGGYGAVKNGMFTLNWAPPAAGKYYIRVVWTADQNYVEIPVKLLIITAR
jgi:dolichyl-diphosphooligosaccharide--protein glycosyltransferase